MTYLVMAYLDMIHFRLLLCFWKTYLTGILRVFDFWSFSWSFVNAKSFKTTKRVSNLKLSKRDVDSLFPNMLPKHDVDTHISPFSTYSNEIRVPVTYLITVIWINNKKMIFCETFFSYFYWNCHIII